MINEVINVGSFRKSIKEGASEFKARLGAGVETENKKNNEKSYKEAEKRAKDYDGGLGKITKNKIDRSDDNNRTTLDYTTKGEVNDKYTKRVKAQVKGYTSELEAKNGIEKNGELDDDSRIYNSFKKNATERNKAKEELEHSGIVSSKLPKTHKNDLYESKNLVPKRLVFKKTTFINEKQVLSRIPEEYKVDGQKIFMKDSKGNEYIVECAKCQYNGNIETTIVNYNNQTILNEKVNRMKELFEYDSAKAYGSTNKDMRVNENKTFNSLMDHARQLTKDANKE